MKLKEGMLLHDVGEEHMAVASGEAAESFHGLIRNNPTADFIYHQLMTECTKDELISRVFEKYDAPLEVITRDVENLLDKMRQAGILEE